MTLGERIHQLRKEKNMSQEELGSLLLVSRQTVSLWENNQTIPTVDNLIRLKEIFGVTVDSILSGDEIDNNIHTASHVSKIPTDSSSRYPIEKYRFSLDKKELKYFHLISTEALLKRLVVSVILVLFSFCVNYLDATKEQNSYFIVLLAFIFFCVNLFRYIYVSILVKKNSDLVCSREYTYEIFYDHIFIRVSKSDEEIKTQKLFLNEIVKCWESPFCFFLQNKDRTIFTIKKSVLEENSNLRYFCNNLKSSKTDWSSTKILFLKTTGNILFAGCFICLFFAVSISLNTSSQNNEAYNSGMEALRVFHIFLPVPLLSIVFGILLNKNKIRNKKNIICGVIIGSIMLIYGFFPVIFGNMENNLDALESELGFEFPQTIGMNYSVTSNINSGKQAFTSLSFEETTADSFEELIQSDNRWIKGSNKEFERIIPENLIDFPTDYFLLYDITASEFGKYPKSDGAHQLIYVAYSSELNVAYICEYQVII